VGHPDLLVIAHTAQQPGIRARKKVQYGKAELAFVTLSDRSAEQVRDQLLAITNSEDRNTCDQCGALYERARLVVDAVRATRDNNASGVKQFFGRNFARQYFGRDAEFPYLTSDEVAVLTAGVEYGYLRWFS
jgi:hypothetical protein